MKSDVGVVVGVFVLVCCSSLFLRFLSASNFCLSFLHAFNDFDEKFASSCHVFFVFCVILDRVISFCCSSVQLP